MRPAFDPAVLARPLPGRPTPPTPRYPTREAFLADAIPREPDARLLKPTKHGFVRRHPEGDRPYIALRCHCPHAACDGWILVHDDPQAVAHFNRLFGAPAEEAEAPP